MIRSSIQCSNLNRGCTKWHLYADFSKPLDVFKINSFKIVSANFNCIYQTQLSCPFLILLPPTQEHLQELIQLRYVMSVLLNKKMGTPLFHDFKKQASFFLKEKFKTARLALTDVTPAEL